MILSWEMSDVGQDDMLYSTKVESSPILIRCGDTTMILLSSPHNLKVVTDKHKKSNLLMDVCIRGTTDYRHAG